VIRSSLSNSSNATSKAIGDPIMINRTLAD
jgi:hypothetical protein